MKYEVVEAGSKMYLERYVARRIAEGWVPIGGVCVLYDQTNLGTVGFYQAMIKMEDDDERVGK